MRVAGIACHITQRGVDGRQTFRETGETGETGDRRAVNLVFSEPLLTFSDNVVCRGSIRSRDCR